MSGVRFSDAALSSGVSSTTGLQTTARALCHPARRSGEGRCGMTQTPQTPAGWYPQGNVQRWWDGNAWTEHTQPLPGGQPTMQQPYQLPQPPQKSNTARNVLIVIG